MNDTVSKAMSTFLQTLLTATQEEYATAAERYANARVSEMECDDHKPVEKLAAITRIMASGENPATKKAWSYSSAEEAVETDAIYAEVLARRREAVRRTILARAHMDIALLTAKAVAL